MKKIYASVLLSAALVSIGGQVASAAPTTQGTTTGIVELKKGDTGTVTPTDPKDPTKPVDPETPSKPDPNHGNDELTFTLIPGDINFGSHQVNAQNIAAGMTLKGLQAVSSDGPNKGKPTTSPNAVQVYDGRLGQDDWHVSLTSSAFTNGNGKTLTGASLKFKNVVAQANDKTTASPGKVKTKFTGTEFTIATDGKAIELFGSDGQAKLTNDLVFLNENIDLEIPSKAIVDDGTYSATLTWDLYDSALS